MQLPKGYPASLTFTIPANVVVTVNVSRGDVIVPTFTATPTAGEKKVEVPVPYEVLHDEGQFTIDISFSFNGQTFTRSNKVNVYTPYLQLWELQDIIGATATEEECWKVEAAVRNIINAHCGQSFGFGPKTINVTGNGDKVLYMPERLVRLDTLVEGGNTRFDRNNTLHQQTFLGDGQFISAGDGWFLKIPEWSNGSWMGTYTSRNPIVAPSRVSGKYRNNVAYTLTGLFGYEVVPEEVIEAAKLLVNDYACAEQIYRDRFLESVAASDWTLNYYSAAYYKTGNARANLLLSPYVVNKMKVI